MCAAHTLKQQQMRAKPSRLAGSGGLFSRPTHRLNAAALDPLTLVSRLSTCRSKKCGKKTQTIHLTTMAPLGAMCILLMDSEAFVSAPAFR